MRKYFLLLAFTITAFFSHAQYLSTAKYLKAAEFRSETSVPSTTEVQKKVDWILIATGGVLLISAAVIANGANNTWQTVAGIMAVCGVFYIAYCAIDLILLNSEKNRSMSATIGFEKSFAPVVAAQTFPAVGFKFKF